MQIQTAVIHVDRSHNADLIVHQVTLCVNESRRILIDADTGTDQRLIIRTRQRIDHALVRDSRRHQPHIYATLCRHAECVLHLVINCQIRRENIHVILRLVQQFQVHILRQGLALKRRIAVRQHIAVCGERLRMVAVRQVFFAVVIGVVERIPQFQTHQRKAVRRLAVDPQTGILPVSEPFLLVDIFVRQVESTRIGNIAVDHRDLPVIPVVHHRRKRWSERIKRHDVDAGIRKLLAELFRQASHAAQVVIDKAHFHSCGCLFFQHRLDGIPHHPVCHNEIFHENVMFCPFQIFQQMRIRLICKRIVVHLGILIDGKSTAFQVKAGLSHSLRQCSRRASHLRTQTNDPSAVVQLAAHFPGRSLVAEQQIHQTAQHRKRADKQQPQDLIRRIPRLVDDIKLDQQAQRHKSGIDPGGILRQPQKQDQKPRQLNQNQQSDNHKPAG